MENYPAAARKTELRKWTRRTLELDEARGNRFSLPISEFAVVVVEAMIGQITFPAILFLA